MKVLLLNPYRDVRRYVPSHLLPYVRYTPTDIGEYCLLPLDLAYLAGTLRDRADVAILDAHALKMAPEWIDFAPFDAVVMNTAPYSHWRCCQSFVGHVHDCARLAGEAGCRTVVYGPHATVAPDGFKEADCVLVGEPEALIEEALTGTACLLGPVAMERLPVPDYGKFDFALYSSARSQQVFERRDFGPIGVLSYSRGCPFGCSFCFRALAPRTVRNHTID